MEKDKILDNFYLSRFIDSLEKDFDQWESKGCGASTGETWTEWYGPTYENQMSVKIQFAETLVITGAYINGRTGWSVPFWTYYNPFSYQGKRLRKALKKMKSHVREKKRRERNEELLSAL